MLPVVGDNNEDGDDCSFGNSSHYVTPEDSAREWYANYTQVVKTSKDTSERDSFSESMNIESFQEFGDLLKSGIISGMTELNSDSLVAATYEKITDALPHCLGRGCSFVDCAIVI